MKIVIRAGGTGTRLWPLSRVSRPKQFQSIIGKETMLRATYERIAPLLKSPDDLFVSVNKNFVPAAAIEIPEIIKHNIIPETDTRNTGPAICLEVCFLEKFCRPDDIIATLPSDDFISDPVAFRNLLIMTEEFIKEHPDYILTPAIRPDYPDTGYTYFRAGSNLQSGGEETVYAVADTVEKPDYDYCRELIASGVYYCHTGMYLWSLKHIAGLFKKWQPAMYDICTQAVGLMIKGADFQAIHELYSQLDKISIETAITEKTDKVAMSVSNKIGWSDLGKWHIVKRMLQPSIEENLTRGKVIVSDGRNNLVISNAKNKLIVLNDVNDLAVIDTDDALFISTLEKSAEVKKIVDQLKQSGEDSYI